MLTTSFPCSLFCFCACGLCSQRVFVDQTIHNLHRQTDRRGVGGHMEQLAFLKAPFNWKQKWCAHLRTIVAIYFNLSPQKHGQRKFTLQFDLLRLLLRNLTMLQSKGNKGWHVFSFSFFSFLVFAVTPGHSFFSRNAFSPQRLFLLQ